MKERDLQRVRHYASIVVNFLVNSNPSGWSRTTRPPSSERSCEPERCFFIDDQFLLILSIGCDGTEYQVAKMGLPTWTLHHRDDLAGQRAFESPFPGSIRSNFLEQSFHVMNAISEHNRIC